MTVLEGIIPWILDLVVDIAEDCACLSRVSWRGGKFNSCGGKYIVEEGDNRVASSEAVAETGASIDVIRVGKGVVGRVRKHAGGIESHVERFTAGLVVVLSHFGLHRGRTVSSQPVY